MGSQRLIALLIAARQRAGLKQNALSQRMKRAPNWVSRVESETLGIKFGDVERWAEETGHRLHIALIPNEIPPVNDEGLTAAEQATIARLMAATRTLQPETRSQLWREVTRALDTWEEVDRHTGKDRALIERVLRLMGRGRGAEE